MKYHRNVDDKENSTKTYNNGRIFHNTNFLVAGSQALIKNRAIICSNFLKYNLVYTIFRCRDWLKLEKKFVPISKIQNSILSISLKISMTSVSIYPVEVQHVRSLYNGSKLITCYRRNGKYRIESRR